MKKGKHHITVVFQSKIFLGLLITISIFSVFRLVKEVIKRHKISVEIVNLKSQITTLKEDQRSLSSLIDYLSSDAYIEEQARKKLNLSKPGESLIIVNDSNEKLSNKQTPIADQTVNLWWEYFFSDYEKE
jgi:cell division protein FtsB